MISKEEYLFQTKHAVSALFDCLSEYRRLYQRSIRPVKSFTGPTLEGCLEQHKSWLSIPDIAAQFAAAEKAEEQYWAIYFSARVISGSILQIACKAIELFSKGGHLDKDDPILHGCKAPQIKRAEKFASGRLVRKVPLGLIILAGRNQYNHLEEKELHTLSRNVFNELARNHDYGDLSDPGFDLSDSTINYSSSVCSLIGWNSYQPYLLDMEDLLK